MKILQDTSQEAEYIGKVQENRVGIDKENIDFITTLLTSNLYSKPIESFLRETVANAYDSHIEANSNEYILLVINKIGTFSRKYTISVRDYGVGVSPERFNQIYRNIGSSTKRESNDYIGCFGIGRFAGLSCADAVNINSYYNNTKYSYIMYKNGRGINIDKLSEQHGDSSKVFKNGLEISVTVNCDDRELVTAIEKLCLFDKLYIELLNGNQASGYLNSAVNNFNNRKVSDFNTFSLCSLFERNKYIRVGNIMYDNSMWGDLMTGNGIIINIPIGEVDITPNREELQYTDRTKEAIRRYISKFKQEAQEIFNETQSKDFTLGQFYHLVSSDYMELKYKGCNVIINKKDISVDNSKCTIKGSKVPDGFDKFLNEISFVSVDKDFIYKVFNSGISYRYRKINKGSVNLDCIISESAYLGNKCDKIVKSVTLDWYTSNLKRKCAVVLYNIDDLKTKIKSYLYDSDANSVNEYINYLFNALELHNLSNSDVPEEYKSTYKKVHSKTTTVNSNEIPVRVYSRSVDKTYYNDFLKHIPKTGPVIYSVNTKDADNISTIATLLNSIATVITVKKEHLKLFESNSRFILMEDFIDLPNNLLRKLTTAYIIKRKYLSLEELLGYGRLNEMPIMKEFRHKYKPYIMACNSHVMSNSFVSNILDRYEKNGWYNKADVEYFEITDEDKDALATIVDMKNNKTSIVECMAFFMFGRRSKIGLVKPNINICKYLKQFKHGCI